MATDWPLLAINEVAELVAMGPFGSSIKVETFVPSGVPIISGQHLRSFRLDESSGFNFISEEHADRLKKANVQAGDVIFTHAGNIGQVAYIPESSRYERYVISQRQFYMRCNQAAILPEFVVAYFKSPQGQHQLLANASQVGVPSIAQPVTYLRTIPVPVPPLREQHAITNILGFLDDKIELNRRMSETLEQTARTLFREWFVSPPDEPEMRQAWEVKPLDEIADFLNGAVSQRYPPVEGEASLPVIKIRELNQGITEQSGRVTAAIPKKWHVEDGDVLFSWSGTLVAKKWTGGRAALNQHLFKVSSSTYPQWFFFQWILHHLDAFQGIAADKATTMGHIRRRHLSEAKCLIPDPATLKAMSNIMQPLHRRRLMCDLESRTLAELRDTLLPKLISGEIRVPQAERLVSEVV